MAKFDLIYFYLAIKNKNPIEQVLVKLKTVFTHLNCNLTNSSGKTIKWTQFFVFPQLNS
jgi:transcription elongation factor Elf1